MHKLMYRVGLVGLILFVLVSMFLLCISAYMKHTVEHCIFQEAAAYNKAQADCVVVLGARVGEDGTVSRILQDRLDAGIALYQSGAALKLLMSGDHGTQSYDEVNV